MYRHGPSHRLSGAICQRQCGDAAWEHGMDLQQDDHESGASLYRSEPDRDPWGHIPGWLTLLLSDA